MTIIAFVVLMCYGGGFGTMPAFAADYFGPKNVGPIYGLMLTAWGFASAFVPLLIAYMREASGSYHKEPSPHRWTHGGFNDTSNPDFATKTSRRRTEHSARPGLFHPPSLSSFVTPVSAVSTFDRNVVAAHRALPLTLKRERSIHLRWHHKIPRTRRGYEAERDRPWSMKTKHLISLLVGIAFVALGPVTWAAGHGGGGGGGFHGGGFGGGGFHGGGGGRGGGAVWRGTLREDSVLLEQDSVVVPRTTMAEACVS